MNETAIWTGRALSGIYVVFSLGASIVPKLLNAAAAQNALDQLGWESRNALMIGIIELVCVALYLVPITSVLGAILTTALLGGAIASQLRINAPMFTHVLFGTYLAMFMWRGLWLREPALRAMIPLKFN